jgi:DNA-directed RNA polymerase specialized sigma24 family protein
MLSDEQLMLEFKAGNTEAFAELFQRYSNPIYAFFRRRLNTANRAEDMTQVHADGHGRLKNVPMQG